MDEAERVRFESHPQWRAATQLREWDDTGKKTDAVDPPFEQFVPLLHRVAIRESSQTLS
jgi:predicted HD phosphohydrolase